MSKKPHICWCVPLISISFALSGCGGNHFCTSHDDCDADSRCLYNVCYDVPLPCGKAPPKDCDRDLSHDECAQAGGNWTCYRTCYCRCPSGDEGCPCWDGDHCQGACMGDDSSHNCSEVVIGTCSQFQEEYKIGCHCVHHEGRFVVLCAS